VVLTGWFSIKKLKFEKRFLHFRPDGFDRVVLTGWFSIKKLKFEKRFLKGWFSNKKFKVLKTFFERGRRVVLNGRLVFNKKVKV